MVHVPYAYSKPLCNRRQTLAQRLNYRKKSYLIGQNFSADKIFGTYLKFRQFCPTKNFHRFLISLCTLQGKNVLTFNLTLIWHVLIFSGQNISAEKIFGGQKFSVDKIFGSKADFRQFCPPKFCPIRYHLFIHDYHFVDQYFQKMYELTRSKNLWIRFKSGRISPHQGGLNGMVFIHFLCSTTSS